MPMTITDKWALMMQSFADIKAAIEEKGGSVSGGYITYANGVRSIYYGSPSEPIEQYPAKSDVPFPYIFTQIIFCAACKEDIRRAIVAGGVACDTTVPLSDYADKIRQISAFEIVTASLPSGEYNVAYSAQLEARGGKAPYTWSFGGGFRPSGITVNSDGTVTGTPTSTGGYNTYIRCTDSDGTTIEKSVYIRIAPRSITAVQVGPSEFYYDGEEHFVKFECQEDPSVELTSYAYNGDNTSPGNRMIYVSAVMGSKYYSVTNSRHSIRIINTSLTVAPEDSSTNTNYFSAYEADNVNFKLSAYGGTPPYTWTEINWGGNSLADVGITMDENGYLTGYIVSGAGGQTRKYKARVTDSTGATTEGFYTIALYGSNIEMF